MKTSWCGSDLQTRQVYLEQTTLVHLLLALLGLFWTTIFSKSFRSSRSEVLLRKGVLKICRKFTREHPCRSVISIKFLCNFIEIRLRHGCSPVNVLHILRTCFLKNKSGRLLLIIDQCRYFLCRQQGLIFWWICLKTALHSFFGQCKNLVRILSRYSRISKLKTIKDLTFKNSQNTLKRQV